MTDWDRYATWINDYFPDPSYEIEEVRDFIKKETPHMKSKDVENIIDDWANFVGKPRDIIDRVKSIWERFKGLFRRKSK